MKGIFDTFIVGDKAIPEAVYRDAIEQHRPKLQRLYAETFAKYRLDALIFPTTPLPAQLLEDSNESDRSTARGCRPSSRSSPTPIRAAMPAFPAWRCPMGMTAGGLPLGIELDGPSGSDRRLLVDRPRARSLARPVPAPKRWSRRALARHDPPPAS